MSLNNFASVPFARFDLMGQHADLRVALHREALELQFAPHPNRSMSLNNLASVLSARFDLMGQHADLQEAILLHTTKQPGAHHNRSKSLVNLAGVLSTRFDQTNHLIVLGEAAAMCRETLELLDQDHPDRSKALDKLATIRFSHTGQHVDLDDAQFLQEIRATIYA